MRSKYTDFVEVEDLRKQDADGNITRRVFRCPYDAENGNHTCRTLLTIAEERIKNNKGSRCLDHLLWCNGKDSSGRFARDDARVCRQRTAVSDARSRMRHRRSTIAVTSTTLYTSADEEEDGVDNKPMEDRTIAVAANSSVQPMRPTPVDAVSCITLPSNEDVFLRSFLQQMLSSDDLLRQMVAPKRAAAQLLNLYAQVDGASKEQFELFQKAFAVNTAEAALDVVRRSYGEATDSMLVHAAGKLAELQRDFPELAERAKSNDAAEDALCLTHLHAVCKRTGIAVQTRQQFSALYLGQYAEIRMRFAGATTVRRDQMKKFFCEDHTGRRAWLALCTKAGLPANPFDPQLYQIEHILNSAWGGADHYLNHAVLHTPLNNSSEFRYGPGEVKMILLGRAVHGFVQRFARWDKAAPAATPRDAFLSVEENAFSLPVVSLLNTNTITRHFAKRARE